MSRGEDNANPYEPPQTISVPDAKTKTAHSLKAVILILFGLLILWWFIRAVMGWSGFSVELKGFFQAW